MKVLIACEYSGKVRDAFIEKGHDAISCDIVPTESPGPHIEADVTTVLDNNWDLMIAHPPCTYLSNSGVRWLYSQPDRWQHLIHAAVFFRALITAPIPKIAVENPVIHRWAQLIIGPTPTQIIQPYQFGHPEYKTTNLWLKNLPPLTPTNDVKQELLSLPKNKQTRIHHMGESKNRSKLRSETYTGIAQAMAQQWG